MSVIKYSSSKVDQPMHQIRDESWLTLEAEGSENEVSLFGG